MDFRLQNAFWACNPCTGFKFCGSFLTSLLQWVHKRDLSNGFTKDTSPQRKSSLRYRFRVARFLVGEEIASRDQSAGDHCRLERRKFHAAAVGLLPSARTCAFYRQHFGTLFLKEQVNRSFSLSNKLTKDKRQGREVHGCTR